MARARPRTKRKGWRMPEEMQLELKSLLKRAETVAFTASTVMGALLRQDMGRDREMAICVEQLIAEELDALTEQGAQMLTRWGGEPYTPLLRDMLLGIRSARRLARS